jgi:hypothetical protein
MARYCCKQELKGSKGDHHGRVQKLKDSCDELLRNETNDERQENGVAARYYVQYS